MVSNRWLLTSEGKMGKYTRANGATTNLKVLVPLFGLISLKKLENGVLAKNLVMVSSEIVTLVGKTVNSSGHSLVGFWFFDELDSYEEESKEDRSKQEALDAEIEKNEKEIKKQIVILREKYAPKVWKICEYTH